MRKIIDMLISYEIPFSYEKEGYDTIVLDIQHFVENSYSIYLVQDEIMKEHNEIMAVTWDNFNKKVHLIFKNVYDEDKEMKEG